MMGKIGRSAKILILGAAIILGTVAATPVLEKNKYFEILKNIEIYTNVYKELNTYYVDDLDPGRLMRTGLVSMVESLDPFTNYISESEIEGYRINTEGNYRGIGALTEKMGDYVTITELFKDQPAAKAGLKVGDKITQVNGKDAKGKTVIEIENIFQGVPGTTLNMTIQRPGVNKPVDISLVRGEVNVPNVPYFSMVDPEIGYVNLTTFTRNAGKNIRNAIVELRGQAPDGMKGMVLDLRNNGGGLLNEAVEICNLFVDKGETVVTIKGKVKEWDRNFRTESSTLDKEIPLVVLINKRSASASEIVSGVMQDFDRGVLMGQRSYGKGLVQNTRDIGYNAKLKLTTAKYYIPSGRCIQSVEYKDGEPVDIPDDKRTPFKTRGGRQVLDGGGVKPDVYLDKPELAPIVKNLVDQHLIFDFVSEFCSKNDSIVAIEEFNFTGFNDFVKYLEDRNFKYETDLEKLVNQLKETATKENQQIDREIKDIQSKIDQVKKTALMDEKDTIINLIELEIAGRYYFQRGKTKMKLRNDDELESAIDLLKDSKRYKEILGIE